MKNTTNTMKKIAALGAALAISVSALSVTASADSYTNYGNTAVCINNIVTVNNDSLTLEPGDTAQIEVECECHHLRATSSNSAVAVCKWDKTGFIGNTVKLNVTAKKAGTVKIKILSTEDGSLLKTLTVTVKSKEADKSSVYSSFYPYYNFVTGYYYTNLTDAANASSYGQSVVFAGSVDCSFMSDSAHTYYSSLTGGYYATYNMALAASRGNSAYVSQKTMTSVNYSSATPYFNFDTNLYYASYDAAANASTYGSVYSGRVDYSYTCDSTHTYYSYMTGFYYTSYDMALAASRGNSTYVTVEQAYDTRGNSYYSAEYCFYSSTTGFYYSSYDVAVANSYNSDCVYCGPMDSSVVSDLSHTYYSSLTGLYYSNYNMALADSQGMSAYVSYVLL